MRILTITDAMAELCRISNRWGMVIHMYDRDANTMPDVDPSEIVKAAPYLNLFEHGQHLVDGYACLLFDCEAECYDAFNRTVGDDGPTASNTYAGPARVGALMISADGELITENT